MDLCPYPTRRDSPDEFPGRTWNEETFQYDYDHWDVSVSPSTEVWRTIACLTAKFIETQIVKVLFYPEPPQDVIDWVGQKAQAQADRRNRIIGQSREALEKSVQARVKALKERRKVRRLWGDTRSINEEINRIQSEVADYDRWNSPTRSPASLSKPRIPLTARQRVVYE